jgi:hypothetical protein
VSELERLSVEIRRHLAAINEHRQQLEGRTTATPA